MAGLVLQNEAEAPPALLAEWLEQRGIDSRVVRVWEEGVPEDPTRYDWIAALGSESSANDREPAWIPQEIDLLRSAVASEVPVLGICFGGQALAAAMDAAVGPADPVAIGWYESETTDPAVVPAGPWLHFNFENFSVPAGATQIARYPSGPSAFRAGPHLGVQFHPEVTAEVVEVWIELGPDKLAEVGIAPAAVREGNRRFAAAAARQAHALFDAWWELSAGGVDSRGRDPFGQVDG